MDTAEKERVTKLLGMLGSSFDGERANAARLLAKMAEDRKFTINELIAQAVQPATSQPPPKSPIMPDDDFHDIGNDLLSMLKGIGDKDPALVRRVLTDWEINFAKDVGGRYTHDYDLSEKQLHYVEKVLRKARRWGLA